MRTENGELNSSMLLLSTVILFPFTVLIGSQFTSVIESGSAYQLFLMASGLIGFNVFGAVLISRRVPRKLLIYGAILSTMLSVIYAVYYLREGMNPATVHGRSHRANN
jgi:uncharacterized membrane protein